MKQKSDIDVIKHMPESRPQELIKNKLLAEIIEEITGHQIDPNKPIEHADVEALREYYEDIIGMMPGNVYWMNRDCVLLGCNNYMAKLAGLNSANAVMGKTNYDAPWSDKADIFTENSKKAMRTGKTITVEETARCADGSVVTALTKKAPLRNKKGEIIGVVGISLDITDQKKLEEKLKAAEIQIRALEEKIAGVQALLGTVAHELRTPLRAIESAANGVKRHLPILMQAYQILDKTKSDIAEINPLDYQALLPALDNIAFETNALFTLIETLLMNARQTNINQVKLEPLSIISCVNEAIEHYPFRDQEKSLIKWQPSANDDFMIKANSTLMLHVFYNLLRNAIYYIKKAQKGDITITLKKDEKHNYLHFKDTGMGISKEDLPQLFQLFFTRTLHGTGLGLAFCKAVMKHLGGDIQCQSELSQYTEFVLIFPKI